MNKFIKWTLKIIGFVLLIFIGFKVLLFVLFYGLFGKSYTTEDLIDNYNSKTAEILEVKKYINSVTSPDLKVDIEFEDNKTLGIFHISANGSHESNWDVKIKSEKVDSLLKVIGWTIETLKTLKVKLDNANCISVSNGEPCNIGFQRSGMGKYFYNLFDTPIADSLKNNYNDSCTYILYNDKVVLEYGGGAIGSQCFPNYKRGGP